MKLLKNIWGWISSIFCKENTTYKECDLSELAGSINPSNEKYIVLQLHNRTKEDHTVKVFNRYDSSPVLVSNLNAIDGDVYFGYIRLLDSISTNPNYKIKLIRIQSECIKGLDRLNLVVRDYDSIGGAIHTSPLLLKKHEDQAIDSVIEKTVNIKLTSETDIEIPVKAESYLTCTFIVSKND